MKQPHLTILAAFLGCLSVSKAMAQSTNEAAAQVVSTGTFQGRVLAPFYEQVLNNPASLTAIVFLCIVAFVLDDTPIINSRYVTHIVITLGGCSYWLFAGTDSVPHYFPHPAAVLMVNGMAAGIIAGLGHRYFIAFLVNYMRNKFGMDQVPASKKFLREPSDPTQILSIGQTENNNQK